MKIMITGASGFVGQNLLAHLLDKGMSVDIIDRKMLLANVINIPSEVTTVIHLAGKAHDLRQSSDVNDYYDINFGLTKNLYQAFLLSEASKFIFVSSVKAAADIVTGELTENVMPKPGTDYGKSKLLAEQFLQNQVLPSGKSYYILRPCMIHGPGNKGNLNLLFRVVRWGLPYPLASFKNKRSFLSIANFNMIVQSIVDKQLESGIYNLADDQSLSTNEVIEIIAKVLGFKARLWELNVKLVYAIAKIGDWLSLPLNSERLTKLTENFVVSNNKIKEALGLKNLPTSSKQGLIDTLKSFKK